jgi:hypothetical protein
MFSLCRSRGKKAHNRSNRNIQHTQAMDPLKQRSMATIPNANCEAFLYAI